MEKKLKTRIFKNMFLMVTIFIGISVCVFTAILYGNVEKQIVEGNAADAIYVKNFLEKIGIENMEGMEIPEGRRVTIMDLDGKVLFDSITDSSEMENHRERPEIQHAMESGTGEDKRLSDTLLEMTYYYAVKISSGEILRVATTSDTVYQTFRAVWPLVMILTAVILGVALLVSEYLTKKIVMPLNTLDLSDPERIIVYDEMWPFVTKIKKQNEVIMRQMDDLRKKQIEFETITENMSEGLIILGRGGRIISYNKSALELLEITASQKDINNIIYFSRNSRFQAAVNNALGGKNDQCIIDLSDRVCQIIANPVMDNNEIKGGIILIIDATEKEKMESLRREFSANVSHELKTPLTSISGYAEIMKSGIVKEEDMVKFADIIYTEAARLINLVGDIIKVSKLDEDNIQLEDEEINLLDMCENIVKRLAPQLEKKSIDAKVIWNEGNKDNYVIKGVSQIVDEIIYNVAENAVKYNKNQGQVRVKVESHTDTVSVSIKDTGIGIPRSDVERVFERFYRVDKSHSKEVGGTGLGLSIVKHGAAYMGAIVSLDSVENVGTTVVIEFKRSGN